MKVKSEIIETENPQKKPSKVKKLWSYSKDFVTHFGKVIGTSYSNWKHFQEEKKQLTKLEQSIKQDYSKTTKKTKVIGGIAGLADLATPVLVSIIPQLSIGVAAGAMFLSQCATRLFGAYASKSVRMMKSEVDLDEKKKFAISYVNSESTDINKFKEQVPKVARAKTDYLDTGVDVMRKKVSLGLSGAFLCYLSLPAAALLAGITGYNYLLNLYSLRHRKATQREAVKNNNQYGMMIDRVIGAAQNFRRTNNYNYVEDKIESARDMAYQAELQDATKENELNNKNVPFFSFTSAALWSVSLLAGSGAVDSGGSVFAALGTFAAAMMLAERVLENATTLLNLKLKQINIYRGYDENMKGLEYTKENIRTGSKTLDTSNGDVKISNLSYMYESGKGVEDVSLSFSKGEIHVLAGESGSGKTTIMKMIDHELDPQEGTVTLDGIPLTDLTKDTVCQQIAVIEQEPQFMHETIRNEMRLYNENATDEEMRAVLERVKLGDLSLDRETYKEGKATLSGGQLQRLAIARALLRQSSVLLMDEPTSKLDAGCKQEVWDTIESLKQDKTIIIVSHDAFEIANAERLVIMESGRIQDEGTPASLMEKGNEYLISVQNRAQNSVIENDIETAQPTAYLNVAKQVQDPFSKTENSYSSGSSFSPIVMDFYTLGMCYQEAKTIQQRGTLEKPIEVINNKSTEKNHHLAMQKIKQSENE